jgi:hypothetical protein
MAMDGKFGGNTEGRDAKGHFSTGNPGKPQGARHKATQAALALLSGEAEGLTRKGGGAGPGRRRDRPALVSRTAGAALPGSTA